MSPTGRVLSTTLSSPPATMSMNPLLGTGNAATFAGDLCMNPVEGAGCTYTHSASAPTAFYEVVFPTGPTPVSFVHFFNRVTTGCGAGTAACEWRITNGFGNVTLHSPSGRVVTSAVMQATPVTTFTYDAPTGATTPDPTSAFQTNPTNRLLKPRFVRVNAAPGQCLHFRELMVLDTTFTNVALMKPTTGSAQFGGDTFNSVPVVYGTEQAVDGVVGALDNNFGNMVRAQAVMQAAVLRRSRSRGMRAARSLSRDA